MGLLLNNPVLKYNLSFSTSVKANEQFDKSFKEHVIRHHVLSSLMKSMHCVQRDLKWGRYGKIVL